MRPWIQQGGGVLAADSPRLAVRDAAAVRAQPGCRRSSPATSASAALLSVHKTTLRKAEPTVGGAWHQDGAFMGGCHARSTCGCRSRAAATWRPGSTSSRAALDDVVIDARRDARRRADPGQEPREAAGDMPILRPVFEPGDALFFDELFLHQTASDPSMPNPRFAIESWFFGARRSRPTTRRSRSDRRRRPARAGSTPGSSGSDRAPAGGSASSTLVASGRAAVDQDEEHADRARRAADAARRVICSPAAARAATIRNGS